jgi:hypothetical protein
MEAHDGQVTHRTRRTPHFWCRCAAGLITPRVFRVALVLLVALATCIARGDSRQKTDIVYMKNGDKITGEIQTLDKGQLFIKPDYTTTAFILDWNKVDHIKSSQQFAVTDPTGQVYVGSIGQGPQANSVAVVSAVTKTLPGNSVVEIDQLGKTFFRRMKGNIALGLSFAKSNAQKNFSLQMGLAYQSEEKLFSFDSYSQFASQKQTTNTQETSVKTSLYQRLRNSNWYAGGLTNFLSSAEQKVDLRSTLGLGVEKRLIFTNRTNLSVGGALAYTVETDAANSTNPDRPNSLDSAFALDYSTFRFDSTTFNTVVWVYPSLSEPGHIRMTLDQDLYYKLPKNFNLSVTFYDNYDNQPVEAAPQNNLGVTSSLGWSFP